MEPQTKNRVMIVGNWKSWGILSTIKELCNLLLAKLQYDSQKVELVAAPGYLHIPLVRGMLPDTIEVAAQDVSPYDNGDYTGEISAKLLSQHKVKWVILGHSDRREKFGEKDELIAQKMEQIMSQGLNAIICVGEKLDEKDEGKIDEVVNKQLSAVKGNLQCIIDKILDWERIAIAYEPLWSYNTGRSISPDQAQDSMEIIKRWVKTNVSPEIAATMRIIYAGDRKSVV